MKITKSGHYKGIHIKMRIGTICMKRDAAFDQQRLDVIVIYATSLHVWFLIVQ